MPNWHESMQQTFEYYVVDPGTWKDTTKLDNVTGCSIQRDSDVATLGSAIIDVTESVGECYIRVYLVTIQNGLRERHPLGTFLVQTPSSSFDGKIRTVSMDAYTPLLELKENMPPIGYFLPKDEKIMAAASRLADEHARAPVVSTETDDITYYDFVADTDETWLDYISALLANAKYTFALDEMGRIMFAPKQETASLQPVWTYDDDNSSILYPDFTINHDLYGIPNAVEVIHSAGSTTHYAKVVNDDPNSPISTVNRGREIVHRITNPDLISSDPLKSQIDEYAIRALEELSTIEYTVTYSHGYCPVRVGDCVRLNYARAGINNVKAKVISQSIKCEPGCPVQEKAVFTNKLFNVTSNEKLKLIPPIIYLETVTIEYTNSILGTAVLGQMTLGAAEKLDAPVISLETYDDPEEPVVEKLDTPVIYLETVNDEPEEPDEPTVEKLIAPIIYKTST